MLCVLHKKWKEKVRKRGVGRPAAAAVKFLMDLRLGVPIAAVYGMFSTLLYQAREREKLFWCLILLKTFWGSSFLALASFPFSLWIRSLLWHTLEHQRVCETVVVTSAQRWPNRLLLPLLRLSFRYYLLLVYTDMIRISKQGRLSKSLSRKNKSKKGEEFFED